MKPAVARPQTELSRGPGAEEALAASTGWPGAEEALAALTGWPDAVVVLEPARIGVPGRVRYVNDAACALFGCPAAELVGRSADSLVPPELDPRELSAFVEQLALGHRITMPMRLVTADGVRELECTSTPLLRDGQVVQVTSVLRQDRREDEVARALRDISEQRQHAEQLAEARDQAVEQSRRSAAFVAMSSHELRTPIHGVLGLSELLIEAAEAEGPAGQDAGLRGLAQAVHDSTATLARLIDDLIDFGHLESGQFTVTMAPCPLRPLIRDAVEVVRLKAQDKGLVLTTLVADDTPTTVITDALRLRQVLVNLLGNAVKFTETGEVRLEVLAAWGSPSNCRLRLRVVDTGSGVDPGEIEQLFQPYVQAAATRARFGGSGLGLAISRQLVRLMDGEISMAPARGGGTAVEVDLPVVVVPEAPPEEPAEPESVPLPRARMLVAEDHAVNQLFLRTLLDQLGQDVVLVADGEQAVAAARQERFDLILMDCSMPGMDGFEATRAIRALEQRLGRHPSTIIATTASVLAAEQEACAVAGMDDFLAKPFNRVELVEVLARWLTGRRRPRWARSQEDTLPRLVDELGAPVLARMIEVFCGELSKRVAAIRAVAGTDLAEAAERAHALRSVSLVLGRWALAAVCERIELAAREGTAVPDAVLVELAAAAADADGELEVYLAAVPEESRR